MVQDMAQALEQVLEGMPEPASLQLVTTGEGESVVMAGKWVLHRFATDDAGMRKLAMVSLTQARYPVMTVAAVFGVHPNYLSTLRKTAREQGSAGLVKTMGRPAMLSPAQLAQARRWAGEGVTGQEIARRLQVSDTMISRLVGAARRVPEPVPDEFAYTETEPEPEVEVEPASAAVSGLEAQPGSASGRLGVATVTSRYAGAMLLHAFLDRVGAARVFAPLGGPAGRSRFDDVAVLTAATVAFALGTGSVEAIKHLIRAQVGPLAGMARLPTLRTLRPRLADLAEGCDPLALQATLAEAMVAADAPLMNLYFVDDHFVPYEGAKPVGKGYNTKRRHAQKGLADTLVTDYSGRAVCFVTGAPSGLTKTLPTALTELRKVTGDAKIMLGFDRGGAYASVFAHCRDADVDWITYRRGGLVTSHTDPRRHHLARADRPGECVTLADETVTIDGYGHARQLTLFETGQPTLQVLTSDTTAPAAALLAWLRCRWRIENVLKYLTAHHGIDWLCHYGADTGPDTTIIDNPARKKARAAAKRAESTLADAQRKLAQLLSSNASVTTKNAAIPTTQTIITKAERAVARAHEELKKIPAKIPANQADPHAKRAILRTQRRSLQMVLRLLAFNAEHWLADRLNTYLTDPDEYRATLRNLLHLGGTITYTTNAITVTLDTPTPPQNTQALRLLLDELNTTPPHIPGDPRPITYTINTAQPTSTVILTQLPEV
jgi:hypothetical protein